MYVCVCVCVCVCLCVCIYLFIYLSIVSNSVDTFCFIFRQIDSNQDRKTMYIFLTFFLQTLFFVQVVIN